jgi:glyoxylase I family protein
MRVTPAGLHHVSINVPDVPAGTAFYCDLLGLVQDHERPDFGFGGAWLNAGNQQVHLIEGATPPKMGQHFALLYDDLDGVVEDLRARGLEVGDPVPSGPNHRQAFVTDPWGNVIELHQYPANGPA